MLQVVFKVRGGGRGVQDWRGRGRGEGEGRVCRPVCAGVCYHFGSLHPRITRLKESIQIVIEFEAGHI